LQRQPISCRTGRGGPSIKGGPDQGFGRSRGGYTSKIHLRADRLGRPIAFTITGGQASDSKHLQSLMELPVSIPAPKHLLGDKGYDSDDNRGSLLTCNIRPVIPPRRSRKLAIPYDKTLYRERNLIERMINKLKQNRRVATRYDKTTSSFAAFVTLAAMKLWLPTFVNTA